MAHKDEIEKLLKQDRALWVKLTDSDLVWRYGGLSFGKHTALLQSDPDHLGRRYTVQVRHVTTAEISAVLTAPASQPRQGDSSAGLPGVMDMPEYAVQFGYRYTSGVAGAVRETP